MKRLQELVAVGDGLTEGATESGTSETPIDLNLECLQGGNEGLALD